MAELTIEQLRRALVPPAAPPEAAIAAFRAMVVAAPIAPPPPAGPVAWLRRNWLVLLAAVVAAVVAGLAATYLLNLNPPAGVIKDVGHELGLPIDSHKLEQAQSTAVDLRDALAAGDLAEARRLATKLQRQLTRLDRGERAKVSGADELIARGLAASPGPGSGPGSATAPQPGPDGASGNSGGGATGGGGGG